MSQCVFWFRRDLRLRDNTALHAALSSGYKVQPVFIFDTQILEHLDKDDARVSLIHQQLTALNKELSRYNCSILCIHDTVINAWKYILKEMEVKAVFANEDYEPYAIQRDKQVQELLESENRSFSFYKDHVIFNQSEVLKTDGTPYTVYTPYKKKWLDNFSQITLKPEQEINGSQFSFSSYTIPSIESLGFEISSIAIPALHLEVIQNYALTRDNPVLLTSHVGVHLRFGTISIRELVLAADASQVYLSELIWREFFIQILYHYPRVVNQNFKIQYDRVRWRNDESEFKKWCSGETGFPIVDAGMRQLNQTGFMHNRVRMIAASFLCKDLLIDWQWGEAYFAQKLLDYELASNNGNWQWAAGTGCDAAPYFRIFNPEEQQKKFDPNLEYIRKWIPNYNPSNYIQPIVDHKKARLRALEAYRPD